MMFHKTSRLLQAVLFYHKCQIGPGVLVLWPSEGACTGNGHIMFGPHTGQWSSDSAAFDFTPIYIHLSGFFVVYLDCVVLFSAEIWKVLCIKH